MLGSQDLLEEPEPANARQDSLVSVSNWSLHSKASSVDVQKHIKLGQITPWPSSTCLLEQPESTTSTVDREGEENCPKTLVFCQNEMKKLHDEIARLKCRERKLLAKVFQIEEILNEIFEETLHY